MSDRWTPTLDDFVDVAGVVLDAADEAIRRLPRLPLAESAIVAPFASFGGVDAYPTLTEQAALQTSNRTPAPSSGSPPAPPTAPRS